MRSGRKALLESAKTKFCTYIYPCKSGKLCRHYKENVFDLAKKVMLKARPTRNPALNKTFTALLVLLCCLPTSGQCHGDDDNSDSTKSKTFEYDVVPLRPIDLTKTREQYFQSLSSSQQIWTTAKVKLINKLRLESKFNLDGCAFTFRVAPDGHISQIIPVRYNKLEEETEQVDRAGILLISKLGPFPSTKLKRGAYIKFDKYPIIDLRI